MKKFLNRALIYKEWKNVAWFVLLCTVMLAFIKYSDVGDVVCTAKNMSSLDDYFVYYNKMIYEQSYTIALLIFGEIILSFLIFGLDKRKNYYKLSSMPFTRKEIINSKVFISIISLFTIFTVSLIVLIVEYFYNYEILSRIFVVSMLFKWYGINLLTSISTVIFLGIIQNVTGNAIVGSILGGLSLAVPYGVSNIFYYIRKTCWYVSEFSRYNRLKDIEWNVQMNWFEKVVKNMSFSTYNTTNYNGLVNSPSLDNLGYTVSMIILVAAIILFYVLLVYSFQNSPFDKMDHVFLFSPVEYIFKIAFPICCGLIIVCFTMADTAFKVNYTWYFCSLLILEFIVSTAAISGTTNKIINAYKK